MKRAVILINPYLETETEFYQSRRIAEELTRLGAFARILPNAWLTGVDGAGFSEDLSEQFDFCVYLDKEKYTPRVLEARGMRLYNRAEAVEICDDKALTHIALAGKVPMPRTFFAPLCYKPNAAVEAAERRAEELGYPVVVKECFGSLGKQVRLARDGEELCAILREIKLRPYLLQEFVSESAGRDLRVVCVGGEVVACMERRSEGDFRSNLSLGGKGIPFAPTEEVRALAKQISGRIGLDYCGIDLLFSKDGFTVCEVNSNAFFGGIERTTGVNVARAYAEYMLRDQA